MEDPAAAIEPVIMDVKLPAGVAGPAPLDFDVRCFLVPHAAGLVLIDAGMPGSADLIGAALKRLDAGWEDISDIVLTHNHIDHVGGLQAVVAAAPTAVIWAGAEDHPGIPVQQDLRSLSEGTDVRGLRAVETPGHTAGHRSLLHEGRSVLFPGDAAGSDGSVAIRPPAVFTHDAGAAEASLSRLAGLRTDRVLFSHGPELARPREALQALIQGPSVTLT